MKGWCAKITEGQTKLEINNSTNTKKDGFIINSEDTNEDNEQVIPFV
jgi:hypothetical protein